MIAQALVSTVAWESMTRSAPNMQGMARMDFYSVCENVSDIPTTHRTEAVSEAPNVLRAEAAMCVWGGDLALKYSLNTNDNCPIY